MKLKDYLKQFEGMDPEADIILRMADGCCGDYFDLANPLVEEDDKLDKYMKPTGEKYVLIDFPALDFLSSCIRSGTAKHAVQKLLDANKKLRESKN